jgi:hypothetical protein
MNLVLILIYKMFYSVCPCVAIKLGACCKTCTQAHHCCAGRIIVSGLEDTYMQVMLFCCKICK